jgi:hypothetical protein
MLLCAGLAAVALHGGVAQAQQRIPPPRNQEAIKEASQLPQPAASALTRPTIKSVIFVPSSDRRGSNAIRIEGAFFGSSPQGRRIKVLVQRAPRYSGRCVLPENAGICASYAGNVFLTTTSWTDNMIVAQYAPVSHQHVYPNSRARVRVGSTEVRVGGACTMNLANCLTLEQIRRFVAGSFTVGIADGKGDAYLSTTARLDLRDTFVPRGNDPRDQDGDGHMAVARGGDDCDDRDPTRYPGNPEVADLDGHDEDCDPDTVGDRDADADRYFDMSAFNFVNGQLSRGSAYHRDCDDLNASVHHAATEVCDGRDNNCDGWIDELPQCQ